MRYEPSIRPITAGPHRDDFNDAPIAIESKDDPIPANALAIKSLPLASKRPDVTLERIGFHLINRKSDASMHRSWKPSQFSLSCSGKTTDPGHV
jgi:hypothetical protein